MTSWSPHDATGLPSRGHRLPLPDTRAPAAVGPVVTASAQQRHGYHVEGRGAFPDAVPPDGNQGASEK